VVSLVGNLQGYIVTPSANAVVVSAPEGTGLMLGVRIGLTGVRIGLTGVRIGLTGVRIGLTGVRVVGTGAGGEVKFAEGAIKNTPKDRIGGAKDEPSKGF
jgi:hypothetical protein